jgi:hypothetical protein
MFLGIGRFKSKRRCRAAKGLSERKPFLETKVDQALATNAPARPLLARALLQIVMAMCLAATLAQLANALRTNGSAG